MQIVVDIPEYLYEQVLDLYNEPILGLAGDFTQGLIKGVANATPLPKGHGFIAICDSAEISKEIMDDLKKHVYVGNDERPYKFEIIEIIVAEKEDDT